MHIPRMCVLQAGSRDISAHAPHNPLCPLESNALSAFAFYTKSTVRSHCRPPRPGTPAVTPQAPANSPQLLSEKSFDKIINK